LVLKTWTVMGCLCGHPASIAEASPERLPLAFGGLLRGLSDHRISGLAISILTAYMPPPTGTELNPAVLL
jgi:hypothetical protein